MKIETMKLRDFLSQPIHCSCGRIHTTRIESVEIGSGVLHQVAGLIREHGHSKAFVIADCNTHRIAGKKLLEFLQDKNIPHSTFILDEPELVPDERTLGSILMKFDPHCDVIVGVGAGTINDISRFLSYQLGLPYFIVATAPSMDGYASTVAPLITNNLKTTYEAHMPQAIIADLDIVAQAPTEMIAAGFGDILGKFTCLLDWRLSAIINGEYYCETIAEMMRLALNRTIALKEGLASRDKQAVAKLMESLILAGIAMSYAGNSRPASGSEHHLSHFWEMRYLFEGRKAILHGTKVGVATVLILKLHEFLREENISETSFKPVSSFAVEIWAKEIRKVFMNASEEVLKLEQNAGKNLPAKRQQRLESISQHWAEITSILETLPSSQEVVDLLSSLHGPSHPSEIGLDRETLFDSVKYAKEIRPRYTVLQLLWDLDLLDRYAKRLTDEEFDKKTVVS